MQTIWALIQTKSVSSGEAIRNVVAQGFEVYHPKFRARPMRGVRRVLPLFPGYLFVAVNPFGDWRVLSSTKDVRRVFTQGDKPSRIPDREIELLRSLENDLGYIENDVVSAPRFNASQSVVATKGIFQDQYGRYVGLAGNRTDRVRVLFDILGRATVFEVSAFDLAVC